MHAVRARSVHLAALFGLAYAFPAMTHGLPCLLFCGGYCLLTFPDRGSNRTQLAPPCASAVHNSNVRCAALCALALCQMLLSLLAHPAPSASHFSTLVAPVLANLRLTAVSDAQTVLPRVDELRGKQLSEGTTGADPLCMCKTVCV